MRRFESWNGTFSPPRQLPDNGRYKSAVDCLWTVANKQDGYIGIQIPAFELELSDWLAIYDGKPSRATLFGNFTSFTPPPTAFASDALEVNFEFHSSSTLKGANGFEITFKQCGKFFSFNLFLACLNERLVSSHGVIESPNFRRPLKRKESHCSWIIQVPCQDHEWDCGFSVFFDNLNLTNKDWITVRQMENILKIQSSDL